MKTKNKIVIIDYKCGNMFSLKRIFEKLNCETLISEKYEDILNADKLILPGVGSFKVGIDNLKKNNLDKAIFDFLQKGNYLLGICLGMQLLLSSSSEFGMHAGLNIIKGKVEKISNLQNPKLKIPHIGWNSMKICEDKLENSTKKKILYNVKNNSNFYFIHSFKVKTENNLDTWATTKYGENEFSSIIGAKNVIGFQFHPEKSSFVGEKLVYNFLNL